MFIIGISLVSFNCNDDEEGSSGSADLFYDMGPNSAPLFNEGTFRAAVRFPRSLIRNFEGETMDRVSFFLVNLPNNCLIQIYDEGSTDTPGPLLYEADLTASVRANSWNEHSLDTPITLTDRELWIAVEFTHIDQRNTIGCDVGPAIENGDWVIDLNNQGSWSSYRDFTSNAVSINWNIRGFIE